MVYCLFININLIKRKEVFVFIKIKYRNVFFKFLNKESIIRSIIRIIEIKNS